MNIDKLLTVMRTSGQETDVATLQFKNGWGVSIKPDPRGDGDKWNVVVLLEGKPHYDNPIALGNELCGQNDEDVQDICIRIKELDSDSSLVEGLDQAHFEQ